MYSPIFLRTEHELNKALKKQRRGRTDLGILFTSLWDNQSDVLVKEIYKQLPRRSPTPLYIVDSFKMPHAFVIFKTFKIPHLIQFKKGILESEDYLSKIYEELGL